MSDFKPGLEGVVAFQTEIAEPDREGGALRYRGVDIEELVGEVPYEKVWGLLVDENLEPGMPDPEPYDPAALTGNAPSDLQAETARLGAVWNLQKLVDIDAEEARDDLARLSAQMMSIVAKSAAVHDGRDPAPDDVVAQGETAAEKFLLRWRGEANPDHVKAIDTYWICTAEHGLNASTFTARITASTGADCGAAMSAAVGALSGPLHGGAPARVLPMLDEVAKTGDPEGYVKRPARQARDDHGLRPSRLPGRGPALAHPQADGEGARVAANRSRRGARGGGARRAAQAKARLRDRDERRVLLRGRPRPRRGSARPDAGHVRLRAGRRLGGAHPRGEAHRTADPALGAEYVGPSSARRCPLSELASAAAEAAALAERRRGTGSSPGSERVGRTRSKASPRSSDYRERAVAYRAIGQFRYRQKAELLRRGLEDESPACRGSALISLELLSRDHPGLVNDVRPLLHELASHDDNQAVRRLSILCLSNGSPQRETILILATLAEDDEQDTELRAAARKISETLRKRAAVRTLIRRRSRECAAGRAGALPLPARGGSCRRRSATIR